MNNDEKHQSIIYYGCIMSKVSLLITLLMIIINILSWYIPDIMLNTYGLGLFVTQRVITNPEIILTNIGQMTLGMIATTLPLLSLAFGLCALHQLFTLYRLGHHFSLRAARQLNLAAVGFFLWAIADIVCEPAVTFLITLPKAKRIISHSFSVGHSVALLLSFALTVIAQILRHACRHNNERRNVD
ncbi:hypothetical protein Sant_4041 [Sodalis praecaptivus]|uniref:Uncharacterized protein n=1 Tax=Sodalis praecaptivus TaxID=1239307 RepID=W0I2M4_9GAMM|nr:DUF2975 domain-containing protein [Sodalis praecaptivus]AHF78997.1 hypothetical protein Sant_4041 [Sodalis praecaptivus]